MIRPEEYRNPEKLQIPIQLFFHPDSYKILGLINAKQTVLDFEQEKAVVIGEQPIEVAIVMPKVPGTGDWSTGFEMKLVKIEEDGLSISGPNHISLEQRGAHGFDIAGPVFPSIHILDPKNTYSRNEYISLGYGLRIEDLERALRIKQFILNADEQYQSVLEEIAEEISPLLARFYLLTPDTLQS